MTYILYQAEPMAEKPGREVFSHPQVYMATRWKAKMKRRIGAYSRGEGVLFRTDLGVWYGDSPWLPGGAFHLSA